MLAILAFSTQQPFVFTIAVVLMGRILGFLRYNTYPARVFMGDAGSQFLGFSAGVLSLALTQSTQTILSSALPLLLLGFPIIDTLTVMVMRMREGRSPIHCRPQAPAPQAAGAWASITMRQWLPFTFCRQR